jgi:hypothetical protein
LIGPSDCGWRLDKYKVKTKVGIETTKYRPWRCGKTLCPIDDYFKNRGRGLKLWRFIEHRIKTHQFYAMFRYIMTFPDEVRRRTLEMLNQGKGKECEKLLWRCISLFFDALYPKQGRYHKRDFNAYVVMHTSGDKTPWHPHFECYCERGHFGQIGTDYLDMVRRLWKETIERVFNIEVKTEVNFEFQYFIPKRKRDRARLRRAILYANRSMLVRASLDVKGLDDDDVRVLFLIRQLTSGWRRREGYGAYHSYLKQLDQLEEVLEDDQVDWTTAEHVGVVHILKAKKVQKDWRLLVRDLKTGSEEWIEYQDVEWYPLRR